jgi:hypothetical protein
VAYKGTSVGKAEGPLEEETETVNVGRRVIVDWTALERLKVLWKRRRKRSTLVGGS